MIKSITMKNCATYPESGCTIENCQKVNFFYGPNGSGKSTISNFLRTPDDPRYKDCSLTWDGDNAEEIVVYNREFRTQNFVGDINGVFTLGSATIEDIQQLEELKGRRASLEEECNQRDRTLKGKQEERIQCKDEFKEQVWSHIYKENAGDFQEAFTGLRAKKEKFADKVVEEYKKSHKSTLTQEQLLSRSATLFEKRPEQCEEFAQALPELTRSILDIENAEIWGKVIVGNDDLPIAELVNQLGNSDWVNKGREYIGASARCPFCQQETITSDFKEQIDAFFSGEYEKNILCIRELTEEYRIKTTRLSTCWNLDSFAQNAVKISGIDASKLKDIVGSIEILFKNNLAEMERKQKEPSCKIELRSSEEIIRKIEAVFTDANEAIHRHNQLVLNYNDEKRQLIEDIWSFLMCKYSDMIEKYLGKKSSLDKAERGISENLEKGRKKLADLETEIEKKGANITSVQPTVNEINRSLRSYGFTNFQIVPSPENPNSYQIQRIDGSLAANTLSEGEETFISFLYFLQLAKGATDLSRVSSKRVLVLDDPICSLDSTVLYIVSSMVKELAKDIRNDIGDVNQIFILTHNVFFHKEASFIDGRTKAVNAVHYWIISKDYNVTSIRAYESENPIKTSYELLWRELKENANASTVTVQNIMRRILENYFGILGNTLDERVISSFDTIEDRLTCKSLISWINDGSHSIPDDLYIDSYTDSPDRYKRVFKELFVHMGHEAHYNMMMGED